MQPPDARCLDELDVLLTHLATRQGRASWQRIRKKFDERQFCQRAPLGLIDCFVELETGPRISTREKLARLRAEVDWLQRLLDPPNPPELPKPPEPRSLATNSSTTSSAT